MLSRLSLRIAPCRQCRLLSTRASTIYCPTAEFLETYLSDQPPPPDSTTVYLLSTSLYTQSLQRLITTLQTRLPNSIGSFSQSVPGTLPTLSILTLGSGTTFRTDLSGRPAAEVGRWQRPGRVEHEDDAKGRIIGDSEAVRREEGWAGLWRGDSAQFIPELHGVEAKSFLILTDGLPRPVLSGLDAMYPHASKIGLVSAATPFVTGRPHTLLHNSGIYSSGTVGIALDEEMKLQVEFGLEPLMEPITIASAQGNMLLKIKEGNGNPTQTLMAAIQKRDAGNLGTKDEEFFLAVGDKMVKIQSGDPGRGALSVDMQDSLIAGETVQFMYRREDRIVSLEKEKVVFSALPKSDQDLERKHGQPHLVPGFLGLSEDGLVYGSAVCTVPGAFVSWNT